MLKSYGGVTVYDFQKANMWKRISAALCDFILIAILIVGMAFLLSAVLGYDGYKTKFDELKDSYVEKYDIDLTKNYDSLNEEERAKYDAANEEFMNDSNAIYLNGMIVNLNFIIVIFSVLIAYLVLEFIVPLIFKNGQTVGKKIFGIAVMRVDGVKISPLLLFARTVLGKCTVETLLPMLLLIMVFLGAMGIVGTVVIAGMLIAQIVLLIVTKARTPIHDVLAHTVTVDYASQLIFDTPEDMIAYKKRIHAEQVASEKN